MPRKILLCATGLSPQIVTETVYALACNREPRWIPDEIHLVTTAEGAHRANLTLLSRAPGWFARLAADYALPPIRFDTSTIHIATGADGAPLDDIRSGADNEAAADFIANRIRALTADPASELHVSLAGGRKTMGFYAGYALSLYGRTQDRLSHVLVSAPFETNPDFYYPTPQSQTLYTAAPERRPIDSRDATVTLAEIPFVRLREGLPEALLAGRARFSETVQAAQNALAPISLALAPAQRIAIAGGIQLSLTPIEFALYWLYAERRAANLPGLHWSDADFVPAVLERYRQLVGAHSADFERAESAWSRATKETVDPIHSRIKKKLIAALGPWRAAPYLLARQGRIPATHYDRIGLELPTSAIRIETASLPSRGCYAEPE